MAGTFSRSAPTIDPLFASPHGGGDTMTCTVAVAHPIPRYVLLFGHVTLLERLRMPLNAHCTLDSTVFRDRQDVFEGFICHICRARNPSALRAVALPYRCPRAACSLVDLAAASYVMHPTCCSGGMRPSLGDRLPSRPGRPSRAGGGGFARGGGKVGSGWWHPAAPCISPRGVIQEGKKTASGICGL